ncbi:hypothetical protein C1H46_024953 [Malus baccata]|uniref:Large ribosomal subunit protein uL4 C-terminal domain-containing protein n=1 Tax=Malus baccata TaxID=106549 RepID=A0A540LSQ1_MALBA|nr:hypothetical protein C1H46_024953 [Malus baccata]
MARILEAVMAWWIINEESEWWEIRTVVMEERFVWMRREDNAQIRIIYNQIIISMPPTKGSNGPMEQNPLKNLNAILKLNPYAKATQKMSRMGKQGINVMEDASRSKGGYYKIMVHLLLA